MQFGYEKNTSTTDACLVFKETISSYTKSKIDKVFCLFVDLSKAFDTVDHLLLGKILLKRKIPPDIVLFLMHYLRNQRARIIWKSERGEYIQIEKGVRQGGILSPFLFKLYIDDVLNDICNSNIGCMLGIKRINILAYADDLVLIAQSKEQLEKLYEILCKGMTDLELSINKNKTKCIIFKQKHIKTNFGDSTYIRLVDDNFEIVKQYKYLGHIISDDLSDINDVFFRLNSFYYKFNWVFRNFRNISCDIFYFLFCSFCMPEYGLSIWNLEEISNKAAFKTFNVAFSNSLKKILDVPVSTSSHAVAEIFNQLLFHHLVTFNQIRYFKRILKSSNPVIKVLVCNIKNGYLYRSISNRLFNSYGCDIYTNALDILRSRLFWVQNHEPRTGRPLVPDT